MHCRLEHKCLNSDTIWCDSCEHNDEVPTDNFELDPEFEDEEDEK